MKRLLISLTLAVYASLALAQLTYPIAGIYKKRTAQGIIIFDKYAYLMNDGGLCRKYDLEQKKVVSEFMLASAGSKTHVNAVCLGEECHQQGTMPVVYISECNDRYRCFVEDLSGDKPKLLQTIQAVYYGKTELNVSWVVDTANNAIYSVTRDNSIFKTSGTARNIITQYRLPKISDGKEILLTEKDILNRFDIAFPNILQGVKIKGRYMYIVTGLQESMSTRQDARRAIQVVDLKKKILKNTIDLTYLTTNEPEDMDFYKGRCLLFCGQEGGIYHVKLK